MDIRWLIAFLLLVSVVAALGWGVVIWLTFDRNRQRRAKLAWKRDYFDLVDGTVDYDDIVRSLEAADIAPSHVIDWMRAHSTSSHAGRGE